MVHFVKRLCKVKVNDIVVIAIQKTLDDVVNVLEEMSEAAATFTKPVLLVAEYAVRLKVAIKIPLLARDDRVSCIQGSLTNSLRASLMIDFKLTC